ncbi:MAG: hypothetical protein R3Y59_03175 [bacterium]
MKKLFLLLFVGLMFTPAYSASVGSLNSYLSTDDDEPIEEVTVDDETEGKKKKKSSKVGNFLRRVGESATGINMSTEVFVAAPLDAQKVATVSFVSAVGEIETGDVTVKCLVTPRVAFSGGGGLLDKNPVAADNSGGSFKGSLYHNSMHYQDNISAGTPIPYEYTFSGVPSSSPQFEVIDVDFNYSHSGQTINSAICGSGIQIRNIPIEWKSIAREDGLYVDFHNELEEWGLKLDVESCVGDKSTGVITLTVSATADKNIKDFGMGLSFGETVVYTDAGGYKGKISSKNHNAAIPAGSKGLYYFFFTVPTETTLIKTFKNGFSIVNEGGTLRNQAQMGKDIEIHNIPVVWE